MTLLNHYLQDGANKQARAVLCMLQGFSIEESWNKEYHRYTADVNVARWENCREQGYVVMLRAKNREMLNIAFFEHRNSDNICAIRWVQNGINSPTIDTADFDGACYSDKWDVNKQVSPGQISQMAEWIEEELTEFWNKNLEPLKKAKV